MRGHAPIVVYETVHGSQAYGLDTEASDLDLKGIIVGPCGWYHGYVGGPEQIELGPDHVRYEIRKFFRLAAVANPTLLELLWTEPRHHRIVEPAGERILENRRLFLSRRAEESFVGYALSQLRRIRTHRRWLLEPPQGPPCRADYGLPQQRPIPRDQLGAVESLLRDGRMEEAELTPNFLAILDRERRYGKARREWKQFRTWHRNRNPQRAALEMKFGYDTKHAQHLIRLLRMGCELLQTGQLQVYRADRDELSAIRAGRWSYDELVDGAEALSREVRAAAKASALPATPDEGMLDQLCAEIVRDVLRAGRESARPGR